MISIENVLGVNIYIYSIYNMPYAISIIIYHVCFSDVYLVYTIYILLAL